MSYLDGKYLSDDTVSDAAILLRNAGMLRAMAVNGIDTVDILRVTVANIVEVQELFEVNPLLPIPYKPTHYATLQYIQNYLAGKTDAKDAVNVLADADVALTGNTPLSVDSLTVSNNWRVSLTAQTDPIDNGFYKMVITGGTYELVRTDDFDQVDDEGGLEVTSGAWARVIGGTAYGGWEVQLTTADPLVVGTTPLTFVKYPSALSLTAGDMIKRTGNDFSLDLATLSGLESTNAGQANGQLRVRTDTSALLMDKTLRIDPATNALVAPQWREKTIVLTNTDLTNGYVDTDYPATRGSMTVTVEGAPPLHLNSSYTLNYTSGAGGTSRVTFIGSLATLLAVGETMHLTYKSY